MKSPLDAIGFVYRNQFASDTAWSSWRKAFPQSAGLAILDEGGTVLLDSELRVNQIEAGAKISCSAKGLYVSANDIPRFLKILSIGARALRSNHVLVMEDDVHILGSQLPQLGVFFGLSGVNRRVRLPFKTVLRLLLDGRLHAAIPGYGGCGGAIVSRQILVSAALPATMELVEKYTRGVKEIWGSDEIISICTLAMGGRIRQNPVFTETWRRNWYRKPGIQIVHKVKTDIHRQLLSELSNSD